MNRRNFIQSVLAAALVPKIPAIPKSDYVPALALPGEFVIYNRNMDHFWGCSPYTKKLVKYMERNGAGWLKR